MKPIPTTIPGKENERKLSDSRKPEAFVRTLTITIGDEEERIIPSVGPADTEVEAVLEGEAAIRGP